jgi:hypothetical protein
VWILFLVCFILQDDVKVRPVMHAFFVETLDRTDFYSLSRFKSGFHSLPILIWVSIMDNQLIFGLVSIICQFPIGNQFSLSYLANRPNYHTPP